MNARSLNKRVEFWQNTTVEDGYGGNTVSETLITKSWANVKTFKAGSSQTRNVQDLGITDPNNAITVTLRKRNDINYNSINQFIKYRGVKYVIASSPVNEDFLDAYISFIAVRVKIDYIIDPLITDRFTYTFPFTLS